MQNGAAYAVKKIGFDVYTNWSLEVAHGIQNAKLEKLEDKIREENWILLVQFPAEHHGCHEKQQKVGSEPEIAIEPDELRVIHRRERLPSRNSIISIRQHSSADFY